AADALRESDGIRNDALVLEGEPVARSPGARLDLVEDEQGTVAGGELASRAQVALGQLDDARLALDGLDDERGHVAGGESRLERVDARRKVLDSRQQRLEGRAQRGLAGEAERAHRATVEAVLECQDAGLAREACELDGRLDRLGARVAQEHAVPAREAGESIGELELRLGC